METTTAQAKYDEAYNLAFDKYLDMLEALNAVHAKEKYLAYAEFATTRDNAYVVMQLATK